MLGDGEAAPAELLHGADDAFDLGRRRGVARLARQLCWVWILPLGALAACYAYLLFLFAAFGAEAFGHGLAFAVVAMALGIPSVLFAATTGLGVVVASLCGRWLAALMPRAPSWAVAVIAALAGGALALGAFFVFLRYGG